MKCEYCKHGDPIFIEGKEYYICYKLKKAVEPRKECPFFEEFDDDDIPDWGDIHSDPFDELEFEEEEFFRIDHNDWL